MRLVGYFVFQAIEFLSGVEALQSHAVHFAIALHDMGLLYLTESAQSKLRKYLHITGYYAVLL